jgi:hypothetical protein
MNGKIETKTPTESSEFSPAFTRTLFIATCAILLTVFGLKSTGMFGGRFPQEIIFPAHILAGGITVDNGIKEFQGMELQGIPKKMRLYLLMMLLIDFVIAPASFLFAWQHEFIEKSQEGDPTAGRNRWRANSLIFILSGMVVAYVCIMHTISAMVSPPVFRMMQLNNMIDQNRSRVISDLAAIDFTAKQYFYLPGNKGGGDHSFHSHLDPAGKSWVTLNELGMPAETEAGTYSMKTVKNDTMLILRGVSKARLNDGTNPEYEFYASPIISRPIKIN